MSFHFIKAARATHFIKAARATHFIKAARATHFIKAARAAVLASSVLLAFTATPFAHGFEVGDIEIDHPWSRATPQGARVAAGYMVLKNTGNEADRLVSITGEISGRAEIHEMRVDDKGVMTMRPLAEGLEIPAGGEVALTPGGYHIMFLDLDGGVAEGDRFKGTLTFEKAGEVEVEYAVEAMGGGAEHGDHADHGADAEEGGHSH